MTTAGPHRKVVLYQLQSLDGVAEEPGDWMTDGGEELIENLAGVIATQDTVLLGRGTYDYWVAHWPGSDFEPFAPFINGTPKIVFTSRAFEPTWSNTSVVTTDAVAHVADLRTREGGDIGIHGSLALAQSLWATGLIDELRLVVGAVVAGPGRRGFVADGAGRRLELADVSRSAPGTLFLTYRVADDGA
ncbi:bifunctional deaminase-reductase domain protein [Beutenbergia cavernae DSM 12333]|uniref:Bifunctional deaminase-reductase domain protein n=1 Tax=Beutenbergia cavernae (strain ATCC BAA-8 / DSM 12333 / CCUG 43141 / JCM 11478 / NBRC 16432 / NCIMB 13614 / HKI 0122) TaxID=471853 RepID=C5BZ13_BEUC1|nr:dihydrofolate reductase family protein [Beutenbergia cavernae]ACQ81128.1 bifunctional deaminase-reductase domain protein [Beutenbergia cavernae DSM 12333]